MLTLTSGIDLWILAPAAGDYQGRVACAVAKHTAAAAPLAHARGGTLTRWVRGGSMRTETLSAHTAKPEGHGRVLMMLRSSLAGDEHCLHGRYYDHKDPHVHGWYAG
jgi:hypothetical protein